MHKLRRRDDPQRCGCLKGWCAMPEPVVGAHRLAGRSVAAAYEAIAGAGVASALVGHMPRAQFSPQIRHRRRVLNVLYCDHQVTT